MIEEGGLNNGWMVQADADKNLELDVVEIKAVLRKLNSTHVEDNLDKKV